MVLQGEREAAQQIAAADRVRRRAWPCRNGSRLCTALVVTYHTIAEVLAELPQVEAAWQAVRVSGWFNPLDNAEIVRNMG
ncbi:MAG: hypothetical protein U9R11_02000 [Chloroflexota bacterium]|nr:hypothetical protein [Chloroflexota bacterium]